MPDLNTESAYVVRALHTWIRNLVRTYNIDTIRVDTVKHVRKDFWPDFVREAGVAAMGEVLHGGECLARIRCFA
jgi:alpha-amylase